MQKRRLFGMNGFVVFLLTCFSVAAHAQQPGYLILIDAENKQPFTVSVGDELYSSSGHGHLVLSQLQDSTYHLNLRFSKRNMSEQVYPVVIHQKDQGFQLKGMDSSWVLYNWQTKETIHAMRERDSSRMLYQGVRREDGFSRLMAAVVNDSSVMYNTYTGSGFAAGNPVAAVAKLQPENLKLTAQGEKPKAESLKPIPAKDSAIVINPPPSTVTTPASTTNPPPSTHATPETVALIPAVDKKAIRDSLNKRKSFVKDSLLAVKKADRFTRDSLATARKAALRDSALASKHQIPAVNLLAGADAQRSKDSALAANRENLPVSMPIPAKLTTVKKVREVALKISRKMVFLDTGPDGATDTVILFVYYEKDEVHTKKSVLTQTRIPQAIVKSDPVPPVKQPVKQDSTTEPSSASTGKATAKLVDPGCSVATDADLESLRSAILKENTEQDKIDQASLAFGLKCYSVGQLRLLSALFVSDKARYDLMATARMHIWDYDHFRELADMYSDKNFKKKFLVLADKKS